MKINYNFSHRLVAYVLFVGFFLQSCGGFSNQVIPQEKELISRTTLELSDNPLIITNKKIITSSGYLASFYEDDGELKVDLRANEKQPEPNYKCVPVLVDKGTNLAYLTKLE